MERVRRMTAGLAAGAATPGRSQADSCTVAQGAAMPATRAASAGPGITPRVLAGTDATTEIYGGPSEMEGVMGPQR
jgi:hypothetical protein